MVVEHAPDDVKTGLLAALKTVDHDAQFNLADRIEDTLTHTIEEQEAQAISLQVT